MHIFHHLLTAWELETKLTRASKFVNSSVVKCSPMAISVTLVMKCWRCCQGFKVIWPQWKCADLFPKPVWPGAGCLCRVHKPVYTVWTVLWEQTGPCHTAHPEPLWPCPCRHSCLPGSGFWGVKYVSCNHFFTLCLLLFSTKHLFTSD